MHSGDQVFNTTKTISFYCPVVLDKGGVYDYNVNGGWGDFYQLEQKKETHNVVNTGYIQVNSPLIEWVVITIGNRVSVNINLISPFSTVAVKLKKNLCPGNIL